MKPEELKPITREELEKEKIIPAFTEANISCEYDDFCSRAGNYMRCGTHLSCNCPFYITYRSHEKMGINLTKK